MKKLDITFVATPYDNSEQSCLQKKTTVTFWSLILVKVTQNLINWSLAIKFH